jgi:hypothetical protein
MTLGLVALVMAAVEIVACWIPVAPAAKIDPWVAVRVLWRWSDRTTLFPK